MLEMFPFNIKVNTFRVLNKPILNSQVAFER